MNNPILRIEDNSSLKDNFEVSIETLVTGLLQHLEANKSLSPRKLHNVGVHYLEKSLGLNSEELPSGFKTLMAYNLGFDALYDYFKENYPEKNVYRI
ncbi:hypothetical protein HYU21_04535 [Candidatus Woesearchaeota archaeon]|nr:hypothetical protein [Candidatus Woesearchaeota archaeon]